MKNKPRILFAAFFCSISLLAEVVPEEKTNGTQISAEEKLKLENEITELKSEARRLRLKLQMENAEAHRLRHEMGHSRILRLHSRH
jgi:hypothetical protein